MNFDLCNAECKPPLTVIRGDGLRISAPYAAQRANRALLRAPFWLRDVERAWLADLRALGICTTRLPFLFSESARILWLPDARQALLLTLNEGSPVPKFARELHALVGQHSPVTESDDTVRVVSASDAGWFCGLRGDGSLLQALDLNRCSSCDRWWFATPSAPWQCRACGHRETDRRDTIAATFADQLPAIGRAAA